MGTVPRRAGMRRPTDSQRLRAALEASGRTQDAYARLLGLAGKSSLAPWIAETPRPAPGPAVRLAWLLARHPELAQELVEEFGE